MSGRLALGLAAVGLLGAWVVVAWALWQSQVPGDLELPPIDLTAHVDAETIERAQRYETFFRVEFAVSQLVLLVVLALYARYGIRFTRESAAGPIGTGIFLGMIGLGLAWLSQAPFRLLGIWWSRRYDQTEAGYLEALLDDWIALGAEFVFVAFALAVVMALARRFPRRWWLAAAPVFVGLGLLLSFVYPYLVQTEPLRNARLAAAARLYAERQGTEPIPVRVEDVGDDTNAPNAYAVGLGPSRRIVFWDTMLDGSFDDAELRVVLAHEVAHHSRDHLLEGVAWYALFALPGTWLIAVAARRRGGMAGPAAVPLALLVVAGLNLASLPVYNAISRHMEAEADWVAHGTVRDPDAGARLFAKFTIESLNDPDPPRWSYLLFDSHPSVRERIAMARAWEARAAAAEP